MHDIYIFLILFLPGCFSHSVERKSGNPNIETSTMNKYRAGIMSAESDF